MQYVASLCPHGLPETECLICPALPERAGTRSAPPAERARHGVRLHVGGVVVAVAVIGVVAWLVAGVVFALLHILELLAVGLAAGWAGYRLGRFRGSRPRR
jgi:hypothetical protein